MNHIPSGDLSPCNSGFIGIYEDPIIMFIVSYTHHYGGGVST